MARLPVKAALFGFIIVCARKLAQTTILPSSPKAEGCEWRRAILSEVLRGVGQLIAILMLAGGPVWTQDLPASPGTIWRSPAEAGMRADLSKTHEDTSFVDPNHRYSLAELIDIAERHNPETRVAWERAKQQANLLGVSRSQLYPLITASALAEESRYRVLLGTTFYQQDLAYAQPTLSLFYTLLDFGNRRAQINSAAANLLAADFAFNDTHERIIFAVTASYYELIGAAGEIDAAQATLMNSQTVQSSVEARLQNGLATLPDVLEARADTAQAVYDLETARGTERVSHGRLAQALGVSPTVTIQVQGVESNASTEELKEPVEAAITRALQQRPDLLAQMARLHASDEDIKRAKSNYYPSVSFSGNGDYQYVWGAQQGAGTATTQGETWLGQLSLKWTIFDGRARYNELDRAKSAQREAQAELASMRDQTEAEVWTAYSNVQTAIRQQEAAAALLSASEQSYSAAVDAYRFGVKSFLDVVSSQRVLAQARSAQVQARTRVLTAVADLAFRTGDLLGRTHAGAKP